MEENEECPCCGEKQVDMPVNKLVKGNSRDEAKENPMQNKIEDILSLMGKIKKK